MKQFFQYTRDLGENEHGQRLSEHVFVAVNDIASVTIHKRYTKAYIYPKVGTPHIVYDNNEIIALMEVVNQ